VIPDFGDAVTLVLSAAVAAIASLVLAATNNFHPGYCGNLLMDWVRVLYWPATEGNKVAI